MDSQIIAGFKRISPKLNQMRLSQDAVPFYELMSGAIIWTDERPPFETGTLELGSLRMIWNYRTSVFLGQPRMEYKELWETAFSLAPNWPGFATSRQTATPDIMDLISKGQEVDPLGDICDDNDLETPPTRKPWWKIW